ncbi:IS4 family transposase [Fulvivirga sp. M361]|uniref:IS4 family transposase n=1 Tax=Fulvivirga sp. M361 TaxID=2594266 RepID=UPI001628998C|nr:IS4 family transposase [Fulvivirga sp. M361]
MAKNFSQTIDIQLVEDLAKKSGFVQRSSKLSVRDFLEMLMFGNLQSAGASLNDFCAYLSEEQGFSISKQGIDERFNKEAVDFLKSLLSTELEKKIQVNLSSSDGQHFNSLRVKDFTRWNLLANCSTKYKGYGGNQGVSAAMVSIQYEYDLLTGKIIDLSVNSGTRNDHKDSMELKENINKNDLVIRDLGYISRSFIENVIKKEAYFLNRLPPQLGVYQVKDKQRTVNFKDIVQTMNRKKIDHLDQEVLVGDKQYHRCRMIVTKVPDHIYSKRMALAKRRAKDKGYSVSNEYKSRARLNVYLTNVDNKKMSTQMVVKLYKARWQVELIFKVWKSLGKVNALSKMKVERFECQLMAKLIWLVTNWKMFFVVNSWMYSTSQNNMCSLWKFFKQTLRKPLLLRDMLWRNASIEKWLYSTFQKANQNLRLERKKGKTPFYDIFNQFQLLT